MSESSSVVFQPRESLVVHFSKLEISRVSEILVDVFSGHGYHAITLPKVYEKSRILFSGESREYCMWVNSVFGIKLKILDGQKNEKVVAKYKVDDEGNLAFQFNDEVLEEKRFIQALVREIRPGARISPLLLLSL